MSSISSSPHSTGPTFNTNLSSSQGGVAANTRTVGAQDVKDLSAELDAWIPQASIGSYGAAEQVKLAGSFGALQAVLNPPDPAQQAAINAAIELEMKTGVATIADTMAPAFASQALVQGGVGPEAPQPLTYDSITSTQNNAYERLAEIAALMIAFEQENAKSAQELSNVAAQAALDSHESAAQEHMRAADASRDAAMLRGGMTIAAGAAEIGGGIVAARAAGAKATQEAELSALAPDNAVGRTALTRGIGASASKYEMTNAVKAGTVSLMKSTAEIGGGMWDHDAARHNANAELNTAHANWQEDLRGRHDDSIRNARKAASDEVNIAGEVLSTLARGLKGVAQHL
jgi:hypothetical protein